jgi:DNA-binding XRE family transcriptional regulator
MRLACIDPKRINQARLKAGMTQDDVAYRLRERGHKANARSIRRWESGQHAPHANVVPDLAAVLGVQIEDIYQQNGGELEDDSDEDEAALRRMAHQMIDRGHEDIASDLLHRVRQMKARRSVAA